MTRKAGKARKGAPGGDRRLPTYDEWLANTQAPIRYFWECPPFGLMMDVHPRLDHPEIVERLTKRSLGRADMATICADLNVLIDEEICERIRGSVNLMSATRHGSLMWDSHISDQFDDLHKTLLKIVNESLPLASTVATHALRYHLDNPLSQSSAQAQSLQRRLATFDRLRVSATAALDEIAPGRPGARLKLWHADAFHLADLVTLMAGRGAVDPGFGNPTGKGVLLILRLLEWAGVADQYNEPEPISASKIHSAIRDRP